MAEYQRITERFFFNGISTLPQDALPDGKFPYVLNMRSYQEGVLQPREGLRRRIASSFGGPVHTITRLNDGTAYNGGEAAKRFVGAGGNLFSGNPAGTTYAGIDFGFSGNPLYALSAQPPASPRPFLYVGDTNQQKKYLTDVGFGYNIGIAQPVGPSTEPGVAVQALSSRIFDMGAVWLAAGVSASAPTSSGRVSTSIANILYDNFGSGNSYASIALADMANVTTGTVLQIGGDITIVTDITIAVAETTVQAIRYDSGSQGYCTIQPAGSLGTGQLEVPSLAAYRRRSQISAGTRYAVPRGTAGISAVPYDPDAPVRTIRQMDFPVNCMIEIGGETVRIISVAVGTDGTMSFRCFTTVSHGPGETITGLAAVRAYLVGGYAPGTAVIDLSIGNTITYPVLPQGGNDENTTASVVGGVQSATPVNLAQFSDGRAVLPDDDVHVSIKIDRLTEVTSVRAFFDVDAEINDFTQNYFFYEWRASDIITAIQATNAAIVTPLITAKATAVTNQQIDPASEPDPRRYGRNPTSPEARAAAGRTPTTEAAPRSRATTQPSSGTAVTDDGRRTRVAITPAADQASTSQLALGNNQWIDLRVKVKDLIRVGTDPTRTLGNVQAVEVLVSASAVGRQGDTSITIPPLTVFYGDIWFAGGAGPDVGDVGDPYVYAYRYRSTLTGAVSNPSPASRGGVIARRQGVLLTATPSSDVQVDRIDWYRFGGTLTAYSYIGSGLNSGGGYLDLVKDDSVGTETIQFDNFQPWPTQDLPRLGTCEVVGTAVYRTGGDEFNTRWAPGTIVFVNDRAASIYAVANSALLFVNENMLPGSGNFAVPGATLLGTPLPFWWGDYDGTWFAAGDPNNPGSLFWTQKNNPEQARESNTIVVTSPSEPLMGGGMYSTFPFCMSSEGFFSIVVGGDGSVRAVRTPCGRGLWAPWAFCTGPEGIFFLSDDGIYLTDAGGPAMSITDPDLRAIFPHDGSAGVAVGAIFPPNMSAREKLRLSYIAGFVYFDYEDPDGFGHTLIFEVAKRRWMNDASAVATMTMRVEEPGQGVFDQIIGAADGVIYQYDISALSDVSAPITYGFNTRWQDGGIPRVQKQFGDIALSVNPGGNALGVQVVPVFNDGGNAAPAVNVGAGASARFPFVIDLNNGAGLTARNLGLQVSGATTDADTARPQFYFWEPTLLVKADNALLRATDWDNLGITGAKFVQGVLINANTYGQNKEIIIQKDGGFEAVRLTINHNGEETKQYPQVVQSPPGWPPFITHMVRIVGADDVEWQMLGYQFVWEPAPELATQWETQYTSHDLPGYLSVRDAVVAHESTCPIRLRVVYDDAGIVFSDDYEIQPSGGAYWRTYLPLRARKGKAVKYQLRSSAPFRIYQRDCSVRVLMWGSTESYRQTMPFGGPSRESGARI